jgi:hypothetical protein
MKKLLLLSVFTLLSASLASACPGGNLIQVIDTDEDGNKMVIANYDISTGDRVQMNRSFRIVAITSGKKSVCATADCSKLQEIKNKNIKVTFENFSPEGDEEAISSVTIKGISVGESVPVAKEIPQMIKPPAVREQPISKDVSGETIYPCSKK